MKYLGKSTDSPRGADVKKQTLPLSQPGTDEHRRYWNHREEERTAPGETAGETGEPSGETVKVPTADFVAVACDHEPSDEEWTECLTENGFTAKEIKAILAGK